MMKEIHRWISLVKSSYPENFRRILRQSDFFNFRGIGCSVDPKKGIFEEKKYRKLKLN